MMRHLLRVIRRRVGPVVGFSVLLAGVIGAGVLAGAGTAQAACPGTPVVAGTSCADTGTLTFTAGSLTLASPTALTWTAVNNGLNQGVVDTNTAHQSYIVDDATGSGAGWNVTVSATTFTNGTVSLPLGPGTFTTNGSITSAAATAGPTFVCTSTPGCTLPTDTTVYPPAITCAASSPTPVKIFSASALTGLGSITVGFPGAAPVGWWVTVPANAVPATYTSTVTLEVITGP
jgi:WxL domain surface cell wall-binding